MSSRSRCSIGQRPGAERSPVAIEIERKFLLRDPSWRDAVECSTLLRQGYLALNGSAWLCGL